MFDTELQVAVGTDVDYEALTAEAESLVEEFRQRLPSDLEQIAPGPFLAGILSVVDRSRLNGHDAVRVMQAEARMESHYAACRLASMVEVSLCPPAGPQAEVRRDRSQLEFADTEIAAALHLTRRAAENQLGLGWQLKDRLPRVWNALYAGRIDPARARVIIDATSHLPEETARKVVDRIIGRASTLTTGQLRARIRKLCIEADPDQARERYEEGLAERRVVDETNPDGTANLVGLQLAPHRVGAVIRKVHRLALQAKASGDLRTMDQLRADILLDLLTGNHQPEGNSGGRAVVDLVSDLETLAGLAEKAGEIPGMGPVIADVARQVTAEQHDAEWRYTITDQNGQVLHTGTTRRRPTTTQKRLVQARNRSCVHPGCPMPTLTGLLEQHRASTRRPTAAQKRLVEARNRSCVHPGCRMPAIACDLDHTVAVTDGGATIECNLAPLCRYHHRAKHEAPWQLKRQPDGTYHWTSPLGHKYTTGTDPP